MMKDLLVELESFVERCDKKTNSPMLTLLNSLLISDIFKGNIVPSEWVAKYYLKIFIEDEKIKELMLSGLNKAILELIIYSVYEG